MLLSFEQLLFIIIQVTLHFYYLLHQFVVVIVIFVIEMVADVVGVGVVDVVGDGELLYL